MFAVVLVVVAVAAGVHAEQVPCFTGQTACSEPHGTGLSIIGNVIYCCPEGFMQTFTTISVSGSLQPTCLCARQYYESDCLQTPTDCQGSGVVNPDGYCCNDGEVMSFSNSTINGVPMQTCKCRRYAHLVMTSNGTRETTPQEQAQLSQGLTQVLEGVDSLLSNLFGRRSQPAPQIPQQPIRNAAGNTADTSQRRGTNTMQQNMQRMQARLLQQRGQVQQRLQQQLLRMQQNIQGRGQGQSQSSGGGFWDTFNRFRNDRILGPLFRPQWWFNQDWRGIFGMERNNATTPSPNANTNNSGAGSGSGSAAAATAGQSTTNNNANPGTATNP